MSEAAGGETGGRGERGRKLYCSLSVLEISVYSATWICGVLYSLYTLYLAGMDQVRRNLYWLLSDDQSELCSDQPRRVEVRSGDGEALVEALEVREDVQGLRGPRVDHLEDIRTTG